MIDGRPHPFLAADRDELRRQDLVPPARGFFFFFQMKGDTGEQEGRIAKTAPFCDLLLLNLRIIQTRAKFFAQLTSSIQQVLRPRRLKAPLVT